MQRRRAEHEWLVISQIVQVLSFVVAMLLTGSVCAQSAHEVSLARSLFEEGISLADQGDWAGAADRFERAHTLKPTSGIAFNWASALGNIGKIARASELLLAIVHDPSSTPELRDESEQKLAELAPRIARLKVHVEPGVAPNVAVQVDDKDWPKPVWDVAMPVDPGEHVLVARLGTREIVREPITLGEGELRELSVAAPIQEEVKPLPAPVAAKPLRDEERPHRKPIYKSWVLWTSVGVAVLGGTIAAVVLSRDGSTRTEEPVAGNVGPGVIRWQ